MEQIQFQKTFFDHIKQRLPENISLVEELAGTLNISNDSIYRRIKGEKELSMSELLFLSSKYSISLDRIVNMQDGSFRFNGLLVDGSLEGIKNYLLTLLGALENELKFPGVRFYMEVKELLPLHHFLIPDLAALKIYFWTKVLMKDEFKLKKFRPEDFDESLIQLGERVSKVYLDIDATEIWNVETLNGSLRQISYLWESGCFTSKAQAVHLFDRIRELVNHLECEAEVGEKFLPGSNPKGKEQNFLLYLNNVLLGHNTVLVSNNIYTKAFITHNLLNIISTDDPAFCQYTNETLNRLIRKSTLISVVNEKDRTWFFDQLKEMIDFEKKKL